MDVHPSRFGDFYTLYLANHRHPANRALHALGTTVSIAAIVYYTIHPSWTALLWLPVCAYGFGWLGHLLFERSRPVTARAIWWEPLADLRLFNDLLTGRLAGRRTQSLADELRDSLGVERIRSQG